MKRRWRSLRFLCTALIGCAPLWATPSFAAVQYHAGTLMFVYPQSDGSFVIGFDTSPSTCSAPQTPKYFYVVAGQNGVTADGLKALLATALTAMVSQIQVSIVFDDATTLCYVNRLSMQR